jgi:gas vesicle protein
MTDYENFGDHRSSSNEGAAWGTAVTFLLIGVGIGSVVALLLAPQSGKKTRKVLRRKYEDVVDRVDDLRGNADDAWSKGAGWAAGAARRGSDWASDAARVGSDWASYAAKRVAPIAKAARRSVE